MSDIQLIFSVILRILNKPFVVLGCRLTLMGVIIGGALIALVGLLFFGVFDD